jgi:hypothetical protein
MTDGTNPLAEAVITVDVIEVAATRTGPAVTPAKKPPALQMPKRLRPLCQTGQKFCKPSSQCTKQVTDRINHGTKC